MFVLKSLLGKMWGNPANPELIQIPAGQLYLDAVATIRRTGVEYQYQLVVTRAYEEGEEQLLDEDAETDDERVFLIDQALEFRFGSLDGDATCAWNDLSGDEGDLWEFVSSKKYLRSHDEATDAELEALKFDEKSKAPLKSTSTTSPLALEEQLSTLTVSEDPFKDVPVLHRAVAELYLFDTETDVFVIQEKEVDADMASNGEFDTWIIVRHNSVPFISAPIDAEMNPRFDMEDVFTEWKDKFTIYMWEGKNRASYAKAKADEQRYIQEAYEDVEMAEPEAEEEEPVESDEEEESQQASTDNEEDESESEETAAFGRGSKNQQLAVGYKNDMSFVTRGDMIGVFAHKDDKLRFRTAIDRVKNVEGKSFSPGKVSAGLWMSS
ncbi:hypothetical protein CI109_103571 [Kwoniella shandongensis]|uniref:Uncharacterized protein n=1 Tax=Kwoniella shandongensis TaxID=1734106 RepID=A0AAJ8LI92_9TREE